VLLAFHAGYAGGFLVAGGVVIALADLAAAEGTGPAQWIVWLRIGLGLVLFWLAWRKWQGRPGPDAGDEMPGWMKRIDRIGAGGAAAIGFAAVVVNPKNIVLVVSGALSIAQATPAPLAQAGALVVFTLVAGIGVALPGLMWLAMGEAAVAPLERLRAFMARHNTLILTLILAALGVVVILNALPYLQLPGS
jgi:hypothetical protein